MQAQATTPQQRRLLAQLAIGVFEAIEAAGDTGAPAGVLYAAMLAHGATKNQFDSFMGTLTRPGFLVLQDNCYHITPAGVSFKPKLLAAVGPAAKV